jgi:putative glycerol-1-phosphate prenyltransferase
MSNLLQQIYSIKNEHKKGLAVLIDPDQPSDSVLNIVQLCKSHLIDFIFVGGSLVTSGVLSKTLQIIKSHFDGPVYIFPGNEFMIDEQADGILFLSLLSGRNPEYLIGKQIVAAPSLAKSNMDIVPTAYLLIDGGRETSVSYISNTKPIPADKPDIASATALAGKLMGMQCIYMDAGSGALHCISSKMIAQVKKQVHLPLIIGGGIRNAEAALNAYKAGADIIVIGNGAEDDKSLIQTIANVRNTIGSSVEV